VLENTRFWQRGAKRLAGGTFNDPGRDLGHFMNNWGYLDEKGGLASWKNVLSYRWVGIQSAFK
jgi:hypothetical protein